MANAGRPRPASGWELWAWFMMRVSGLLLVLLAVGHMFLMHVVYGVERVNFQFIVDRYRNMGWRMYDLAMLLAALIHGFTGLSTVATDYAHKAGWRVFWRGVVYVLLLLFGLVGSVVILTFQPPQ